MPQQNGKEQMLVQARRIDYDYNNHRVSAVGQVQIYYSGSTLEADKAGVVTSVTGVAVPSIDALLMPRLGLRADVKRLPVFGLGCVAGAAGLAGPP